MSGNTQDSTASPSQVLSGVSQCSGPTALCEHEVITSAQWSTGWLQGLMRSTILAAPLYKDLLFALSKAC